MSSLLLPKCHFHLGLNQHWSSIYLKVWYQRSYPWVSEPYYQSSIDMWGVCQGERIFLQPSYLIGSIELHPKLHNVTHSLISWNPRERMFVAQISLLIVTFLSLISWKLSSMQTTQEVNPYPNIAPCVNMWNVTFFFFFFCCLCHLLNVGACIHHITQKAYWSGPH